jgi:hypothetical protein
VSELEAAIERAHRTAAGDDAGHPAVERLQGNGWEYAWEYRLVSGSCDSLLVVAE